MRSYLEQSAMLARLEAARAETGRRIAADERDGQANIAALRFERRGEIEALERKLARQAGAVAAFRVRNRISVPVHEAPS